MGACGLEKEAEWLWRGMYRGSEQGGRMGQVWSGVRARAVTLNWRVWKLHRFATCTTTIGRVYVQ